MNPWILGTIAAVSFLAGWEVNGWRIERNQLRGETKVYQTSIERHDAVASDLSAISRSAVTTEDAIGDATQEGLRAIREYLASHDSCRLSGDDVRVLRENAARRANAEAGH